MKPIKVFYEQVFNGKTLKDDYIRHIEDDSEKEIIRRNLMEDPHVTSVWFEEVKEVN